MFLSRSAVFILACIVLVLGGVLVGHIGRTPERPPTSLRLIDLFADARLEDSPEPATVEEEARLG